MLYLLSLFLSVGSVSAACGEAATLKFTNFKEITALITNKQRLYFQVPAAAQIQKDIYPGSDPFTITVVGGGSPTLTLDRDTIVIVASAVSSAPSRYSTLSLSTGAVVAASLVASGHGMDRTLVGAIAVSALMSTVCAECPMKIYVNIPNYGQDSVATRPANGKLYVAFYSTEERSAVKPIKVSGGTCSLGQCGGASSAGAFGCQCDLLCKKLGDCCADFDKSCESSGASVLNKAGSVAPFSLASVIGAGTCDGRCGLIAATGTCMCDPTCHVRKDCCADKDSKCPVKESKATGCKCSGQKNPGLEAGANGDKDCLSSDPGGKWCYVDTGVCPDGKASASMPGQDWSILACAAGAGGGGAPGAGAPGAGTPGGGAPGAGTPGAGTPGAGTGAKKCKCAAGLVNGDGAGGASCTTKDTDGPTGALQAWCYTDAGACTDGKGSTALPGKEWSYKACEGVKPPVKPPGGGAGGGAGAPVAPTGWTCAAALYNAEDSCDCNCGIRDPDCSIAALPTTNCLGGQKCDATGKCATPAAPGGGAGAVRGAKLGCTGPSPPASAGLRRQLTFMPRIVGGAAINPPFKQKHLVSLQTGTGFHFCGGSLIADGTWVLSAAHCLQGAAYGQVPPNLGQIVMHRHDLRTPLTAEGATAFKAHKVYNHKDYNPATQENDIALIKLAAPGGGALQPAQLPANMKGHVIKMDDGSFAVENQYVTVAGWGALASGGRSPPIAQQVTVQYITNAKCQLKGGKAGQPNQYNGRIKASMLCAGQPSGAPGKDSCQGDSGGPLTTSCMIGGQPRAVLVGVVSWGFGCALANLPGVYAAVSKYSTWMTGLIGANPNSFN